MSFQEFKSDSDCAAGRHRSAPKKSNMVIWPLM